MTSNDPSEEKIAQRRRWPWVLVATGTVFLVVGGLIILFQAKIAGIAQNTIHDYARQYGIEGAHLDIRQITPWRADIHAFRIDNAASENQLRLDSLVFDYSPSSLNAHVIDGIKMSGLYLKLEKTHSGWAIAGLPPRLPAPPDAPDTTSPGVPRLDWRINRLEIRNSRLEIRQGNRRVDVPFEFQAHVAGPTRHHYRGQLVFKPWDQTLTVSFDLNGAQQQLFVEGKAAALDLSRLSQALAPEGDLPLKGRLAVAGQARLKLAPLTIETAEMQIRPSSAIYLKNSLALRMLNPEQPLATVKWVADRTWALHAPGFTVGTPFRLRVLDWNGRLQPAEGGWQWDGGFNLALAAPTSGPSARSAAPQDNTMPVTYQGQWQEDDQWSLDLAGESTRWAVGLNPELKPSVQAGQFQFNPRLNMRASGQKGHVKIEGDAQLGDFQAVLQQAAVRIPTVSLQAVGEGPWHQFKGRYDVKADNFRVHAKPIDARLPRLSVGGTFEYMNGGLQMSGQTRLSQGVIRLPDQQIKLAGLRLEIPFAWPHDPATAAGSLRLAAATWNDLAVGAVRGRIRQQADGANFRMTHQSQLLQGGNLQVDGRLTRAAGNAAPRVDIDYRFERAASPEDVDLGQLMANLAGIHFNGRIAAEGRGTYRDGQMNAGLKLAFAGGRLVMPEEKTGLVGLKGSIVFPDLLAMRSNPRQQFFFERAYVGDIAATDGQLDFQIEPGGVFFLEQSRFQWCRGSVYLPATRVVSGKDDYDFTLWCDRLKLAPLLEQLGAARAEGGGTVSGRIPVRIRKGQFQVDSGFLYSSPGEGGTIRLRGTEMLTAGIPPGTPQYNQLELARQALREYDYDWVKLSLETVPKEDLLRLKLQLMGRPTNPLPFVYDTQAGGFVPADPGSKGSSFDEIKLDVNFSLPLNRLLEYKDLLKLFS